MERWCDGATVRWCDGVMVQQCDGVMWCGVGWYGVGGRHAVLCDVALRWDR